MWPNLGPSAIHLFPKMNQSKTHVPKQDSFFNKHKKIHIKIIYLKFSLLVENKIYFLLLAYHTYVSLISTLDEW